MTKTKLTNEQKQQRAEKLVAKLEQNGTIKRIGRLITASYHLCKAASVVMTEAQEIIYDSGCYRHMLKRLLIDFEKLSDRIGRTFNDTYIENSPEYAERIRRDFCILFPRMVRDMGIEHDLQDLMAGMMADFDTFDGKAEDGKILTRTINFRVTEYTYNKLHEIADYYELAFPHMMRQMTRLWCERNHTRKKINE